MSDEMFIDHCAPTLAGLKTGNMFTCAFESAAELRSDIRRMSDDGEFPHEIGLFLSYPPEDVRGFIKNRRSGCKLVGTWKVYGDEENAKHKFALYKKCTDTYRRQWADGEWMRTWEADAKDAGLTLACDCVIANEAPDDEAEAACKALGAALV